MHKITVKELGVAPQYVVLPWWASSEHDWTVARVMGDKIYHASSYEMVRHIISHPEIFGQSKFAKDVSRFFADWMTLFGDGMDPVHAEAHTSYLHFVVDNHLRLQQAGIGSIKTLLQTLKAAPGKVSDLTASIVGGAMDQVFYGGYLLDPEDYEAAMNVMLGSFYSVSDKLKDPLKSRSEMEQERIFLQAVNKVLNLGYNSFITIVRERKVEDTLWAAMAKVQSGIIRSQLDQLGVVVVESGGDYEERAVSLTKMLESKQTQITSTQFGTAVARAVAVELWAMRAAQAHTLEVAITTCIHILALDQPLQEMLREAAQKGGAELAEAVKVFMAIALGPNPPAPLLSRNLREGQSAAPIGIEVDSHKTLFLNLFKAGRNFFGINHNDPILPYAEMYRQAMNGDFGDLEPMISLIFGGESPKHCIGDGVTRALLGVLISKLPDYQIPPMERHHFKMSVGVNLSIECDSPIQFV